MCLGKTNLLECITEEDKSLKHFFKSCSPLDDLCHFHVSGHLSRKHKIQTPANKKINLFLLFVKHSGVGRNLKLTCGIVCFFRRRNEQLSSS